MAESRGGNQRQPATEVAEEFLARVGETGRSATEQAEVVLAHIGRVAGLMKFVGRVFFARVADEAEDLWAEAQSVRRGDAATATVEVSRGAEEPETIEATAAARRRAEELGVDLREVEGTGSGGRITVGDVRKRAEAGS